MKYPRVKLIIILSALLSTFLYYQIYPTQNESIVINSPTDSSDNETSQPKNTLQLSSPSKKPEIALSEVGSMYLSKDSYWWLNSGGKVMISGNSIYTIQGDLSSNDRWATTYKRTNPAETDGGMHPQNIFRLVSKKKYQKVTQEVKFIIKKYNTSPDSHRAASNGVLFFHHYQDGNNLYYAGLRVDGTGVIKKKMQGTYYTMAQKDFTDSKLYDREKNPILLPMNTEIGLKTEINTIDDNTVIVRLFADLDNTSVWTLLLEAIDDGSKYGGKAITKSGFVGLRSDFMDVEFVDYTATEIN